ncbi:hypothetical protein Glove_593g23 [Diversispora epigaea]|uniref:Uncharacterized protein n=1 Tax=Diversispora epigaea TaxID=1348612 RepID=A0A397G7V6_9GLOM|nr:hypothetical protein Glove_593g23 [Diversispora epigaea]
MMSERGTHEPYVGYDALIYYLQNSNKSYRSFLKSKRDVLISSLSVNSNWNDTDRTWTRNFLREAENLLDQKNFADLKEKVRFFILQREGNS